MLQTKLHPEMEVSFIPSCLYLKFVEWVYLCLCYLHSCFVRYL